MIGNNNARTPGGLFEIGLIEYVRSLAKVGERPGRTAGDNDAEESSPKINLPASGQRFLAGETICRTVPQNFLRLLTEARLIESTWVHSASRLCIRSTRVPFTAVNDASKSRTAGIKTRLRMEKGGRRVATTRVPACGEHARFFSLLFFCSALPSFVRFAVTYPKETTRKRGKRSGGRREGGEGRRQRA